MSSTPLDDAQFELNIALEFGDYDRAERMERIKSALQVCAGSRDTIERLTKERDDFNRSFTIEWTRAREALNRADSLAAELTKAREALMKIAETGGEYTTGDGHARCKEIARAALPATPEPPDA